MEKIEARMIIEIMGRPAEHIKKTMEMLVEKLGQEKGISILSKIIHEPVKVKDSKDLYTTFSEAEVKFESLDLCVAIIFAYMPSNIEIVSPQSFKLANDNLNSVLNSLIQRLHRYEAITKRLVLDRDILINKLNHVLSGKGKVPLTEKPISPYVGRDDIVKTEKKNKKARKKRR